MQYEHLGQTISVNAKNNGSTCYTRLRPSDLPGIWIDRNLTLKLRRKNTNKKYKTLITAMY